MLVTPVALVLRSFRMDSEYLLAPGTLDPGTLDLRTLGLA